MSEPKPFFPDRFEEERNKFDALRGRAVNAYAMVEHSLCKLMAQVLGLPITIAGELFFKIHSMRLRDGIIVDALKAKHGEHSKFLDSFGKLLFTIMQTRNSIVHWSQSIVAAGNVPSFELIHPNVWGLDTNSQKITNDDLKDFIIECATAGGICEAFREFITPETRSTWTPEKVQTWRDIFGQELPCPIPSNHPTFQTGTKFEIQPLAFPP